MNASVVFGQMIGNVGYSEAGGKSRAEQQERAKSQLSQFELPPNSTSSFVECNVLMNVKADEYVAVFGIAHEGTTLAECAEKMDATVEGFQTGLRNLGVDKDAIYVDFITQSKIYAFELEEDILKEKLVGFELKKNVSIHYSDPSLLERFTLLASGLQVYDLVKVDYIVSDIAGVQDKLMAEAAKIIKRKIGRYEQLLDLKLQAPAQVYAEKFAIHYPTQMYDSYNAHESEAIHSVRDRSQYTVHTARKSRTLYFNGLDGDGFDTVINPVTAEPLVQFSLYLKMKYEVKQPVAK
jgi:hypothetical protein